MDQALAKQKELGAGGAKPPRIGQILEDTYKGDPEKLAKIQSASKFYDELQKLQPRPPKVSARAPASPPTPAPPDKPL